MRLRYIVTASGRKAYEIAGAQVPHGLVQKLGDDDTPHFSGRLLMVNALPALLVVVHVVLLAWAVIGMAEWLLPEVPWPLVSNPAFPPWLLLLHWLAVLAGAIAFLGGYIACWRATPVAVALAYAFMAAVCVIEAFWFLTGAGRFVAMTVEFAAYIGIVVLLRRLPSFVSRFSVPHG